MPDAADRKAVPLVAVGHTDGVLSDTWQVGRVSELFEGPVLDDLLQQALAREHPRRDAHVALPWDLPDVFPNLPERDVARLERGHERRSEGKAQYLTTQAAERSVGARRP